VTDPKRIVEEGYDAISERYTALSADSDWRPRRHYLERLIERVPAGRRVLELGCGAGVPATVELARHYHVTGVDLSREQLRRARQNVPQARLIHGDMATLDLPETFDAVVALYSVTHLPRDEQPALFRRVRSWLDPGGVFVVTLAAFETEQWVEPDWLGAPMYFSHFDAPMSLLLLADAGFKLEEAEIITQDGIAGPETFCWVVATTREAGAGLSA
jgi:cyclopropane fatty-acyl-phospholipid synthase-like methyltransferase